MKASFVMLFVLALLEEIFVLLGEYLLNHVRENWEREEREGGGGNGNSEETRVSS